MRVLLLGGTGNLGLRCVQALLAHKHIVILYLRNYDKLRNLVSPTIINELAGIVKGDATDSAGIERAIREHNIEAVVDVAGNQVLPWKEYLLQKIARAVTDAAVAVGKERGKPLRAWLVSGMNILQYPGTPNEHLLQDYILRLGYAQHDGTREVVESVQLSDLRWSLICVAMMKGGDKSIGAFELLDEPRHHNLMIKATSPPAWENTWVMWIPFVGVFLNLWVVILMQYTTTYEDVADFLAEDVETGSEEWIGKRVGMKDKQKIKAA